MKIKKGDTVQMMAGKDRGKKGKVLKVFSEEEKIIVDGLNLVKKHNRPRKEGESGQRVEVPRKINWSNVLFVCPKCSKAARVGSRQEGIKKIRICKKCGLEI
jgi:large subunit ribosomal protein L24